MTHHVDSGEGADELRALLHLRALPGIGDIRLRRLLDHYGTATAALSAPAKALGRDAAAARSTPPVLGRIERSLQTIDRLGIHVLTDVDPAYPPGLRHLHDPPPLVFARGRLELLRRPAIAVVGARRHTLYGGRLARDLAADLSRAGFVVISGLARGIDGAAHEAALDAGAGDSGGATIGVLGCGIDVVYPREHAHLFARIAEEGLLLSEFLPGEPAVRYNFPRRNRIIAALADGVLVVEATGRSGTLITVDHALDLGRDVFAVPGPIDRPTSEGTNRLIQQGAMLVTSVADIATALKTPGIDSTASVELGTVGTVTAAPTPRVATRATMTAPPDLKGELLRLWRRLEVDPLHVDELASACGISTSSALIALLELELRGHARQLVGMRFVREEPAPRRATHA